jgi:hypothetical protein
MAALRGAGGMLNARGPADERFYTIWRVLWYAMDGDHDTALLGLQILRVPERR